MDAYFGTQLRALRRERGITLVQLGRAIGISITYLSQLERGGRPPKPDRLRKILAALGAEHREAEFAAMPRAGSAEALPRHRVRSSRPPSSYARRAQK
jgi:XRE family transcriptional regulator, fatty acid utilization regulator